MWLLILRISSQGLFNGVGQVFITEGLVKNHIHANRSYGISVGHNDTDNVMYGNVISDSGKVGILFRDETQGRDFWANRNRLEKNQIINSGGTDGIGIDVRGRTKDLTIVGNQLRETREPKNRTGIFQGH